MDYKFIPDVLLKCVEYETGNVYFCVTPKDKSDKFFFFSSDYNDFVVGWEEFLKRFMIAVIKITATNKARSEQSKQILQRLNKI